MDIMAILAAIEAGHGLVTEVIQIWKTEDGAIHVAQLKASTEEDFQQQVTTATEWLNARGRE